MNKVTIEDLVELRLAIDKSRVPESGLRYWATPYQVKHLLDVSIVEARKICYKHGTLIVGDVYEFTC
jgi:hypothetical protein